MENLSGKLHKEITSLSRDKDIITLPADKGNVTVINQSEYTAKMKSLREDPAYKNPKETPLSDHHRITHPLPSRESGQDIEHTAWNS